MNSTFGWPYAAKAAIQHEFDTDHLNIWLTFSMPMDITVIPANSVWKVKVDGVSKDVSLSAWQDYYTILLTVPDIGSQPARVLVEYDGPSPDLRITSNPAYAGVDLIYRKQWEPWGPILSIDITS